MSERQNLIYLNVNPAFVLPKLFIKVPGKVNKKSWYMKYVKYNLNIL